MPSFCSAPLRPATQDEQNTAGCGWVPQRGEAIGISLPGFAYPDGTIRYPITIKHHCYHFAIRYRVVPYAETSSFLGTTYSQGA